jgi:hypothetical protein
MSFAIESNTYRQPFPPAQAGTSEALTRLWGTPPLGNLPSTIRPMLPQTPECQGPGASVGGCAQSIIQVINRIIETVQQVLMAISGMIGGITGTPTMVHLGQQSSLQGPAAQAGGIGNASHTTASEGSANGSSSWQDILSVGSSILSIFGAIGSGGLGGIANLGGLLRSGGSKVFDLIKKGLSLFG